MADTAPPQRLPIKVVLPNQGDYRRVPGGGSPPKPFREADDEFRLSLTNQVMAIRRGLARPLKTVGVAPLRVKLTPKAYAKSHRPRDLFSNKTCPIVAAGQLGELFVKATNDGLLRLQDMIEVNKTQSIVKQLSTVQLIEAVTPTFRRKRKSPADVQRSSPRVDDEFFLTRVRLFDFGGTAQDVIDAGSGFQLADRASRRNIRRADRTDGAGSASQLADRASRRRVRAADLADLSGPVDQSGGALQPDGGGAAG